MESQLHGANLGNKMIAAKIDTGRLGMMTLSSEDILGVE